MKIYLAKYCPMIDQSEFVILSAHQSLTGAQMALHNHRMAKKKEWKALHSLANQKNGIFGEHQAWVVDDIELHP